MVAEITRPGTQENNLFDVARTGPRTPGGRLMRSFWQPVGVSDMLTPGRSQPIKVLHEEYTLYRGESGQAHVLDFRCAHRGTQLSTGWVEGDNLRCFYHGWVYDGEGQCVEQPAEPEPFCQRIKLRSYPTYEYLGLIFAYFGEGTPPPRPRYPEFEQGVEVDAAMGIFPFNFFNNLENAVDTLHVSFVHRASNFYEDSRLSDYAENGAEKKSIGGMEGIVVDARGEETEYGFIMRDTFESGSVRIAHFEMPNAIHIKVYPITTESGWRDFIAWKVPIDDESYRNFSITIAYVQGEAAERYRAHPQNPKRQRNREAQLNIQRLGSEILAGNLRLNVADVGELAKSVNLQDFVAQRGQGVIADRPHERLGQSDRLVVLLRHLWTREMNKLADGQAIKQWRWPGYLETTTGA